MAKVWKRTPLKDTEVEELDDWLDSFSSSCQDERHPDALGISRRPEPKSIYSPAGSARNGSIDKPKMSSKPKGSDGKVKLWPGNEHKTLDPYLYRNAGTVQRKR